MPAAVVNPGRRTGFEFSIFNPNRRNPNANTGPSGIPLGNPVQGPAIRPNHGNPTFANVPNNVRPFFDRGMEEIKRSEANRARLINNATGAIDSALVNASAIYGSGRAALADLLPKNPFSDEMRAKFEAAGFDKVAAETGALQNKLAVGLNQRGLSSAGSQGTGAATDLDLAALNARQNVTNDLIANQFETNTKSNIARAGLESGLYSGEAGLAGSLGTAKGNIFTQAAVMEDPSHAVNLLGDAANVILGKEQADVLTQQVNEALANAEPSEWSKIFDAVAGFLFGFGRDRLSQGLGALAGLG